MTESSNIYDLLSRIEWEGDIVDALKFGLRSIDEYDVPDSLKELWDDMVSVYDDLEDFVGVVSAALSAAKNQYDENKEF